MQLAAELKQLTPRGTIVVHADEHTDLLRLLHASDCDIVHYDIWPECIRQWLSLPPSYAPETAKRALQRMEPIARIIQGGSDVQRIELSTCIQANHLGNLPYQAVFDTLAPALAHIRVLEGITACLPAILSLANLHTLTMTAPKKGPKIDEIKKALPSLTELCALHVCTEPTSSAASVNRLLGVLRQMPKVTSLKVVADQGLVLCLCASNLQYIQELQLGSRVTVDHPPSMLMHLQLEDISGSHQGVFQGYSNLFAQLQDLSNSVSLTVDRFCDESLCLMPSKLQNLCLMPPNEQPAYGRHFQLSNQPALMRLSGLKVLFLGEFVTNHLVQRLSGIVLPQLHTFGFQLISQPCYGSDPSSEFAWGLDFPLSARQLAAVFPNLRRLTMNHIRHIGSNCSSVWVNDYNTGFLSHVVFPQLQNVTCHCQNVRMDFLRRESPIPVVIKFQRCCSKSCLSLSANCNC